MSDDIARFYDSLSEDFHLVHHDWRESVRRQGAALDTFVARLLGSPGPHRVLDCSCGIGTQAIGLALHGHRVVGTDLSSGALARARREATSFGVSLETKVADMRRLEEAVGAQFDVVLSCDNSVAHLEPAELATAFRSMANVSRPGGVVLVSVRDYDRLVTERPELTSPVVRRTDAGRRIAFQVWDWEPDRSAYALHQFVVAEHEGAYRTTCETTRLFAHRRGTLLAALTAAGLDDVGWHVPEESGHVQPVATGVRRA